jgi:hypothetical protein
MGSMSQASDPLKEKDLMKHSCILIAVAVALAGCAAPPATTPVSPVEIPVVSPVTTPIAPPEQSGATPTVAPDPLPTSPDTVIVYQREGGFAGTSDEWTIYPTGRIVAGDGSEWQVLAEQVAPLFELVEAPAFKELNTKYAPTGTCNDCYTHTLTVYGQGEPQTVTFVDGAELPAHLQQIWNEVDKAITR